MEKSKLEHQAWIVKQRLDYHFGMVGGKEGEWLNVYGLPFMKEVLNEVNTLCNLAFESDEAERVSADGVFYKCNKCDFTPNMESETDDLVSMNYCPNCGSKFKNYKPKYNPDETYTDGKFPGNITNNPSYFNPIIDDDEDNRRAV